MQGWYDFIVTIKINQVFFIFNKREISANRKDLWASTLMGPARENPALSLAVLHLDNPILRMWIFTWMNINWENDSLEMFDQVKIIHGMKTLSTIAWSLHERIFLKDQSMSSENHDEINLGLGPSAESKAPNSHFTRNPNIKQYWAIFYIPLLPPSPLNQLTLIYYITCVLD